MYVELHTSSAFSFLRGASLPETLIERAAALGYPAIALLDRDGVYGAPRFHLAAKAAGIRAIIGAELTVTSHRFALSGVEGSPVASPQSTTARPPAGDRAAARFPVDRRPSTVDCSWPLSVLVASQEGWR